MFTALSRRSGLEELIIDGNNITGKHVNSLLRTMSQCRVVSLSMNFCKITDVSGIYFATGFKEKTTITQISARNNELGDRTAERFAATLGKICTLIKLDLSNNFINDLGGERLALSLESNQSLRRLHLSGNNLSTATGFRLVRALEHNKTLLYLQIEKNSIPIKIFQQVTDKIASNLQEHQANVLSHL
jgi:Leucine-rich repeat (LRR) protein